VTAFTCPFCNDPAAYPVDVHGHVQCSVCRTNVDPCCGGAACEWIEPDVRERDDA